MCKCTWAFWSINKSNSVAIVFSLFWRENFVVDLGRKHPSPIHFFPLSLPTERLPKSFPFFFFSFFSILPKIHSTKHILRVNVKLGKDVGKNDIQIYTYIHIYIYIYSDRELKLIQLSMNSRLAKLMKVKLLGQIWVKMH